MTDPDFPRDIVVYIGKRHLLERPEEGQFFRWLQLDNDFRHQLEDIIRPFEQQKLTLLADDQPAGEAWQGLLDNLIVERMRCVVTHLAPLSAAQRQQLIGICAQVGTQLITPSDAGRNRRGQNKPAAE